MCFACPAQKQYASLTLVPQGALNFEWRGFFRLPELPEVETIVRGLRPYVTGRRILDAELPSIQANGSGSPVLRRILREPEWKVPTNFIKAVKGSLISRVRRHGKHLVFDLRFSNGNSMQRCLVVHLGMTGRLTCEDTAAARSPHTHLVLSLDQPGLWLHFTDARRFGRLQLLDVSDTALHSLGPEPLEIGFPEFVRLLKTRGAMLKSLLLDQRFLRGLGNIYADESLFRAGLHPTALASRLNRQQALRLYKGIQETLSQAIEFRGSSISNYVDAEGHAGGFQQLHQVYRRTGEPCYDCAARIRKIVVSSRSTHFCPRCQRAGRGRGRSTASLRGGKA